MTTHQFRQQVRATFPHVTVKVRTVSFADLARDSEQCLTVEGERAIEELIAINALAQAGTEDEDCLSADISGRQHQRFQRGQRGPQCFGLFGLQSDTPENRN